MSLITGIHHICLKCTNKRQYEKTIQFYTETLAMNIVRTWDTGIHIDTGCGLIEIFIDETLTDLPQGTIRHYALATKDVDTLVDKVRKAGYEITTEPQDICIPADSPCKARMAFCIGPVGEEIEFFDEK